MRVAASLFCLLPCAVSLVLPRTKQDCLSFASSVDLSEYKGGILNATYHPANSVNITNIFNDISFCEVYGLISYGSSNSLGFTLWLPDSSSYEQRFMAVGNGGMAGTIDTLNMITQLNAGLGFAVAGGDAGHLASENNKGGGAPDVYLPYLHDRNQVGAWIHDAISLFTPAAKALAEAYYGAAAKRSYYDGCSTGGAQGYALAQYHPELFDGIYAGSPATNLTQAILNFTTAAVLVACDANDGVEDGVLENPLACKFDINTLACSSNQNPTSNGQLQCLTEDQLSAAKSIYAGPVRSDDGEQLYSGFSLGSEIEWLLQEGTLADAFSIPILQNLVYDNLDYDSNTFNWATDVNDINQRAGRYIDEIDPDLSKFRDCGGKLISAQGWTDPYNAATWPIEHLQQIQQAMEGDVSEFIELFMVPGGGHCGSAEYYPQAPGTWNVVKPLVEWVERGVKPTSVRASDPVDGSGRTRKLCPWPKVAKFVGGDEDDWESYVCE